MSNSPVMSDPVLHILLALSDRPRHGYAIIKEIEDRTGGAVSLGTGTLYTALKRLRTDGLIGEAPSDAGAGGRRRRTYALTERGRTTLVEQANRLQALLDHARQKGALPDPEARVMILDRLYRSLLRFLPKEFDGQDRAEFWETYVARVQEARATGRVAGTRGRWRELGDLLLVVVRGRLRRSRDHRGGLQGAVPDSTDRKGLPHLGESLGQDVRVGARAIRRSPLATALAAGSLALGVGATTAIFSALDVWLIRPLPLPNAERLVGIGMANYEEGWNNNAFSIPDYADWAREAESVRLAAYARGSFNFSSSQHVERVQGLLASTNIFDVLGIPLVLGRGFSAEDGEWDASLVAVVSHGFWQTALGGSRSAVGVPSSSTAPLIPWSALQRPAMRSPASVRTSGAHCGSRERSGGEVTSWPAWGCSLRVLASALPGRNWTRSRPEWPSSIPIGPSPTRTYARTGTPSTDRSSSRAVSSWPPPRCSSS